MHRSVAALGLLLAAALPASGEDALARTPQSAADAVVAAAKARSADAMRELATAGAPDPWIVADLVLARGERAAAEEFAAAATGPNVARLSDWVNSQSRTRPDPASVEARLRFEKASAERAAGRSSETLRLLEGLDADKSTVLGVLVAFERAAALADQQEQPPAADAFRDAAQRADSIGWLATAAAAWGLAGRAEFQASRLEAARESWGHAVVRQQSLGALDVVAHIESNLAIVEQALGNRERAFEHVRRALELRAGRDDRAGVAESLASLADLYREAGDLGHSVDAYANAAKIDRELSLRGPLGQVLAGLADALVARGDYPQAEAAAEEARTLAIEQGDLRAKAWATAVLGHVLSQSGQTERGAELVEEALGQLDERSDPDAVVATLGRLGEIRAARGEFDAALVAHSREFELAEARGHVIGRSAARAHMGAVYARRGDLSKGLALLSNAAQEFETSKNPCALAGTLIELSDVERQLGRIADALARVDRAQRLSKEARDPLGLARSTQQRALLQFRSDPPLAIALQLEAVRGFETLGRRADVAVALSNLAAFYDEDEDFARARDALSRARAALHGLGHDREVARLLQTEADVEGKSGDTERALRLLVEVETMAAAAKDRRIGLDVLVTRGEVLAAVGAAKDRRSKPGTVSGRGERLPGAEDRKKALEAFDKAKREAERLQIREALVGALEGAARAQLEGGDAARALELARSADPWIAALARGLGDEQSVALRERHVVAYDVGARAAAALGNAAEAAYFLETARATLLRESLGGLDAIDAGRLSEDARAAQSTARAAEGRAQRRYADAVDSGDAARERAAGAELRAARAALLEVASRLQGERRAKLSGVPLEAVETLEVIEQGLRPDEALVVYGLAAPEALALVVTRAGSRILRLGTTAAVEAACEALDASDASHSTAEEVEALRAVVVAPLGLPDATRRVLVSPEGILCYAPFSLLLEGRTVAFVPSGTAYLALGEFRDRRGEKVLAIGDPAYPDDASAAGSPPPAPAPAGSKDGAPAPASRHGASHRRLPGSRGEAQAIGDFTLLGPDATEPRFVEAVASKKGRWRAIHFACHGVVNRDLPMLSALALTPLSDDDDGNLFASEVRDMSLPADLAVLSACQTGSGRIVRGEGVRGLANAFLLAGCPRVIASLWKVEDEATRALMTRFYELWNPRSASGARTGLPTAEALREAQEFVRSQKRWSHPYYWAAWVLWGLPD